MWCPKPDCQYRQDTGLPAEHEAHVSLCPTCGSELVAERPHFVEDEPPELRRLVSVWQTTNLLEAHLVCGGLRWREFDAGVADEYIAHMNWYWAQAVGWIKVVVPEDEAARAKDALRESWRLDADEGESCYPLCPHCEAEAVRRLGVSWLSVFLALAPGIPPLLLPADRYVCERCERVFRAPQPSALKT